MRSRVWQPQLGVVQRLTVDVHDVDVKRAWPPAQLAHPAGRPLALPPKTQPIQRAELRVSRYEHGVEVVVLLDPTPRRGLVDGRDGEHGRAGPIKPVEHRLQVGQPVAEIRPDGEHCAAHGGTPSAGPWPGAGRPRARRERRAVTATSPNGSPIGAAGLCRVTSTACARWSSMTSSAMRAATVSIRLHGSPPTIWAARCASAA